MVVVEIGVAAGAAVAVETEQEQEPGLVLVPGYKQTDGLLVAVGNAAEKCSTMPLPQHLRFPCSFKVSTEPPWKSSK